MRTPEDPCRDPASEARDDHASEPRATPETDAMEYRFINHDSCAGESLERVMDDKDVTWDDAFRGDACPSDFARRLERQRDELTDRWEKSANAFLIEQGKREAAERQRDELLEALESFLGRARMGEVNKGMFVRIEELEGLSAAIAAAKGGQP